MGLDAILAWRHQTFHLCFVVCTQGSDLVLEDCDISSSTGSGVGIEGGSPAIRKCAVHNCERNGIAVFSELGGAAGEPAHPLLYQAPHASVHAIAYWLLCAVAGHNVGVGAALCVSDFRASKAAVC